MRKVEDLLNALIEAGVKPNWLGKRLKDGKLLEYRSLPWVAGPELFVLVQEPDKPETCECVELWTVKPMEQYQKAA